MASETPHLPEGNGVGFDAAGFGWWLRGGRVWGDSLPDPPDYTAERVMGESHVYGLDSHRR